MRRASEIWLFSTASEACASARLIYNIHSPVIPSAARDLLLRDRLFYVYLLASRSRVLYTGITNNLDRRLREHRLGEREGFTKRYRVHRLVCFECYRDVRAAIAREKQIKGWRREKKVALIEAENPTWEDLAPELEETADPSLRSG